MIEGPRSMRPLHAPKAHFDESIALIESGDLAAAEGRIRSRLADYPRDVNLQALLGALLIEAEPAGRGRGAASAGDRGPRASPSPTRTLDTCSSSRATPAMPSRFSSVRRIWIQRSSAWFTLGKALAMQGRGADADQAFERCFALSPERRLMALAAEHHRKGVSRRPSSCIDVSSGNVRATSMRCACSLRSL